METPLRFGIVASTKHPDIALHLEPFCQCLGSVLDTPVISIVTGEYTSLLRELDNNRVDLAWLPPIQALRRASEERFAFLALPVRNGVVSYSTVLFSKRGSLFESTAHLKGARMAWVDPDSAGGHLVLRARLVTDGQNLTELFGEERFCGSHDEVVRAVLNGEADVGATYAHISSNGIVTNAGWTGICSNDDLQIILIEGPIPADVLGAAPSLRTEIAATIQQHLLDDSPSKLQKTARLLFHADRFERPDADHFMLVARLRSRLSAADPTSDW